MSRTPTTTFFSLGEPGRVRALLGSVVLHVLALLGMWQLEPAMAPSDVVTPSMIYADLVYLRGNDAADGGLVPEAPATGAEPQITERRAPDPEISRLVPESPAAVAELRQPEVETLPPTDVPPADAPAAAAESLADPGEAAVPLPVEAPAPVLEPAYVVDRIEAPAPARERSPVPEAEVPEIAGIGDSQRRMLDRKLEQWSARFDELAESELSWRHDDQTYSATFTRMTDSDGMGIEHVLVAVTTEQDGNRWATAMRMKRMAFSSFAQFVDRWDPTVQIHDDQIDGRFHSNSEILIANSEGVQPAFLGKVTTARGIKTTSSPRPVRRSEVFLGGLEIGVRRIALPRHLLPFPVGGEVEPERVQRFERESRIVFHADGSLVWRAIDEDGLPARTDLPDEPFYLVAIDGVTLHVSGVVHGKVLVHTSGDIVIEDDLSYATDPLEFPDGTDFLGLVAGRNVLIAGPATTGPGDLTVQAAIYAEGRFHVRGYGNGGPATLRILGSVAAGSLSATEPRYRTQLQFDPRLQDARPPGFPMTDSYELVAWDGLWTAVSEPESPSGPPPAAVPDP